MIKKTLLVIDLQNEYTSQGKLPLTGIEEATNNAAEIIQCARENNTKIIHVQHIFINDEKPVFEPASTNIEFQSKVTPIAGEDIIVKHNVNSFLNTNLKQILDNHQIEEIVIMGAMTYMCIDAAVRPASDYGYKVTVIHDACATLDIEFNRLKVPAQYAHATLMSAFEFAYAKVISTKEYLA